MQFATGKVLAAVGLAGLFLAAQAQAANYALEITNIKPAGTVIPANHRIYRAYPGFVYNIRAAVIGGAYPYTYSLSNAPAGMTINAQTGEINWPSATGNATPTLTVVDSEGTRATATWSITTSSTGFRFVDAAAGRPSASNGCSSSCGTGAIDSPWRTMSDVFRSRSAAGTTTYFKNGVYQVLDLPRADPGGAWERVEFESPSTSVSWIAYPGHSPIIDFGYNGSNSAPIIRLDGGDVYVDGFETRNSHIMAFQFPSGGNGPTFRRLRLHHHGPGFNGSNASLIMTTRGNATNMVIQNCEFYASPADVTIKIYGQAKLLIEDNVFHDAQNGIELKDSVLQFTVRRNRFYNISNMAIGGNMATDDSPTSGEMLFNNVNASQFALDVNQNGVASRIYIYRNTFVGRVQVRNTSTANGPFTFTRNVIINTDPGNHLYLSNVSAPQVIVLVDNLVGTPSQNIVDASGVLTTAYASYRTTHGHGTLSPTTPTTGGTAPSAPSNVRIVTGS